MRGLRIWSVRVGGSQIWNQTLPCLRGSGTSLATAAATAIPYDLEDSQKERSNADGQPLSSDVIALCRRGNLKEAFGIFGSMDRHSIQGHLDCYGELLQGCAKFKALDIGEQVHANMIREGLESDIVMQNLLVTMYLQCGRVEDARKLFHNMQKRDLSTWSAITSGLAQEGRIDKAVQNLCEMQKEGVKPDVDLFTKVLDAVTKLSYIDHGKLIHLHVLQSGLESNLAMANALLSMYARCGGVEEAFELFDKMPERDYVSWTALLNLYCRLGYLKDAQKVFDLMPMKDVASWSAIIAGHANHGRIEDAFELLCRMQEAGVQPDKVTFLSILSACKSPKSFEHGKEIHAHVIKAKYDKDVRIGNALVKMYTKCGSLADAQQVFDEMCRKDVVAQTALLNAYIKFKRVKEARDIFDKMPKRDVVCWNSMISGYAKLGDGEKALELFHQMEKEQMAPDDMTYVGAINACARTGSLQQGLDIHSRVLSSDFATDQYVQNALLDMYIKCGSLETAQDLFDKMPNRDVVSWNSMLFGFVQSGQRKEALEFFGRMQADGVRPDSITFLGVLSACKKEGLFAEGSRYFVSMRRDYNIKPTGQHYSLLSRDALLAGSQSPK